MRRVDILAAIGLLIFVAVMVGIVIPAENTEGIWYGLSPYFYPMVMLSGLAISSVGLLFQAVTKPDLYKDQPNPLTLEQLGFFLLSFVIILAGVAVIHYAGFLLGGPLLIAAAMVFMGERKPLRILPVAIGTVAAAWAIVWWGLSLPLP